MKFLLPVLVTFLHAVSCHSRIIPTGYVIRPVGTSILPSYDVDGNFLIVHDDLVSHLFDPKFNNRDIFFINQNLRSKRATSFSYTAPDSSRSETFDTYVDPRVEDKHPLNRYRGQVSWNSPEGIPFSLVYSADGGGYHPEANHLPDSPNHRSYFTTGLT